MKEVSEIMKEVSGNHEPRTYFGGVEKNLLNFQECADKIRKNKIDKNSNKNLTTIILACNAEQFLGQKFSLYREGFNCFRLY